MNSFLPKIIVDKLRFKPKRTNKIFAHADGGPRSRVGAGWTLHQLERKYSGTSVCRVTKKFRKFFYKFSCSGNYKHFLFCFVLLKIKTQICVWVWLEWHFILKNLLNKHKVKYVYKHYDWLMDWLIDRSMDWSILVPFLSF